MDFNVEQFANAFAKAMKQAETGYGRKAPTGVITGNWIHGPGGLFGTMGGENEILSLRVAPRGLSQVLRAFPSVYTNPIFHYITGVEENAGAEPSSECATCLSGETEACAQTAQFGYVCRETKELDTARAIERINEGDIDLALVNDMLGRDDLFQPIRNLDRRTIAQIATAWAYMEVGILLQNVLMPMTWTGNPINNVGTGYMEFPGLDILIGTNKIDAFTGVECGALDSDVKDFNYQNINAVDANGNFVIVRLLEYLEAYVYHNAERQNLLPTEWVWVMRPELWYELSNIWPIAYLTSRNLVMPAGTQLNVDAASVRTMLDDMRSGMYLYVNGRRHTVILDDGILELTNVNDRNVAAGSYASSIYLVPITYLGSRPATYYQYLDFMQAQPESALAHGQDYWWTDNGRFQWTIERLKYCYTLSGRIKPRIILKVPQLAGRLNHVLYTPAQHLRSPWQDSDYFFKGGQATRPAPSLWSDWNP